MKFERLELENYRCFEDEVVEFTGGINSICGVNGSGKTTLLEGCFFALYGSDALRHDDVNLDDIPTNGESYTRVMLEFTESGTEYTLVRELKERGERITQTTCELSGGGMDVSGATDVDAEVKKMIKMDSEAFLNCAYIKQGEIYSLIESDGEERRNMIDNLLRLGDLKEYEDRASDIRVGVKRVRKKKRNLLEDRKQSLQELNEENIDDKINAINSEISELKEEIGVLEEELDTKRDECDDIADELESVNDVENEIVDIEESVAELNSEIEAIEEEIDALENSVEEKNELQNELAESIKETVNNEECIQTTQIDRESINTIRDSVISDINDVESDVDRISEQISQKEERVEEITTEINDNEDEIKLNEDKKEERKAEIEDIRSKIQSKKDEKQEVIDRKEELERKKNEMEFDVDSIDDTKEKLEQRREALSDEKSEVKGKKAALESDLTRMNELLGEGKCPECGQEVTEDTHEEKIEALKDKISEKEDERKEIEDELSDVEDEINEAEEFNEVINSIDDRQSEIDRLSNEIEIQTERIDEKENEVDVIRDEIDTIDEKIKSLKNEKESKEEKIDELQEKREAKKSRVDGLAESLDNVEDVLEKVEEISSVKQEIKSKKKEIEYKKETKNQKESIVDEKEANIDEKKSKIQDVDVDDLETKREEYEERIDAINIEIDDIKKELENKQEQKGKLMNKSEEIDRLEDEVSDIEVKLGVLNTVYNDMDDVEKMYDKLRSSIRRENIATLERLLNEIFELLYQNESYSHIELDDNYKSKVIEKSSAELDTDKLSGGESALFNISLRCAIYELLINSSDADVLMPPLVFDEPTIHLDKGHVNKISEIVNRMINIGVEQVIVVSHSEEIIDGTDNKIMVEQKDSENRSVADSQSNVYI